MSDHRREPGDDCEQVEQREVDSAVLLFPFL